MDSGQRCTFLAALPDGTVLANVFNVPNFTSTGQTRRFDPVRREWFHSADVLSLDSIQPYRSAHAFLERGCGPNCGKVLLAIKTAEL